MEPISLSQLNENIKQVLARHLEPSYWVIAEIGELRLNQKGHCYLELIEKEDEQTLAKSRATIWAYNFRNLNGWFEAITGSPLQQGMKILANIQVSFHEIYGFSLNIRDIDPKFTLGERERKKQETIQQLINDGVLEMNKMHHLPLVPQRVAVISASTAAGFGDFMNEIEQSGYRIYIQLYNVLLQGDQAAASIISALHNIAHDGDYDVVVIIRGGGAQIDLDTFNDYDLCSHIAQFPLPIITGIGHERDETIADLVAHTRMKTPTAAADFLISAVYTFEEGIKELQERVNRNAEYRINGAKSQLSLVSEQLKYYTRQHIKTNAMQLKAFQQRSFLAAKRSIMYQQEKTDLLRKEVQKNATKFIELQKSLLSQYQNFAKANAPERILAKGFTISTIDGKSIHSLDKIKPGSAMETLSSRGKITSTIKTVGSHYGKEEN